MAVYDKNHPDMQWWRDSMKTRDERLKWWREARFGCFMHWGVYSNLAGVWQGKHYEGYAEQIMRQAEIPMAVYRKEAVEKFNPTEFNADEWIQILKYAGMRYLVITAKHCDGFAMYHSDVTDYNVVDATPFKRDPMRELKDACDRHGLRFGFYYAHAQDWGHPNGIRNYWEFGHPAEKKPIIWHELEKNKHHITNMSKYMDEKAIPQVIELATKYEPDIIWFDTAFWAPMSENVRVLKALREVRPDIVVNSRIGGGLGDYQSTGDKPAEFPPEEDDDWEAIPTTNESYGYHSMDDQYKPPSHFIELVVKAVARGGNMLMNVGPRGDGKIDDKDVAILKGIGDWMEENGESIHGAGASPLPVQAWGESTRKINTLFLHVFQWPGDGKLVVGGLKSKVSNAYLLSDASKSSLTVERLNDLDAVIHVPDEAPNPIDSVLAVEIDGDLETDSNRLLSPDMFNRLHVFDGHLQSNNLRYGRGHADDDYIQNWSDEESYVAWQVRLTAPVKYEIAVTYTAPEESAGGAFTVEIGGKVLNGTVSAAKKEQITLGKVSLEPGTFEVRVKPSAIKGDELMRLHAVTISPSKDA